MDFHALLRLVHITGFAAWFGTIFASMFLLKTLEPGMTSQEGKAKEYKSLLMRFIGLETRVADAAVILVLVSGLLLAHFYHGWTPWVIVKIVLLVLQIALTMGYIVRRIQPIAYPCDTARYASWYRLFAISLAMFGIVLVVTFFFL
jgi:putative membrane protein